MIKLNQFQHLKAVGYFRIVLSLSLFSIFTLNLITGMINNINLKTVFIMTIPFFLLSIIMFLVSNKNAIILSCLIAGLYSSLNGNTTGDYSASIFFIFSFHLSKNKKYGIFLIFTSILCISINAIIVDSRIAVLVGLFIAYTVIYIIYYYFILKPCEDHHNFNLATRTEEEKAILKLYGKGYSYSQISKTLGLNVTDTTIRRKIKAVKDDSKCKNDVQFGQWLFKND